MKYQLQNFKGFSKMNLTSKSLMSNLRIYAGVAALTLGMFLFAAEAKASFINSSVINPGPCTPIVITVEPTPSIVCDGGTATFSVTATGTTPVYQWQENTGSGFVNITDGGIYSGSLTSTLTLTGVNVPMNGYTYQCLVSNICTIATPTIPALLTVNALPTITGQPSNTTSAIGGTRIFSVTASGVVTYQWQENNGSGFANISNGGIYSGATTSSLTLTGITAPMNGYTYQCIVSNVNCSIPSSIATLTVNTPPTIVVQPSPAAACPGTVATFTTTVTGQGLTYQWQENQGSGFVNLTNTGIYSGVLTNTLTLTGVTNPMNGYNYQCVITGTLPPTATTNSVALTINTIPGILIQPAPATVCAGGNTSFAVSASGTGLSYQWQVSNGGPYLNVTNSAVYSGATTATLNITGTPAGISGDTYQCVVSGTCVPAVTSASGLLTVNTLPLVTLSPSPATICAGGTANFVIAATGAGITYQWQENNGGGFVNLSNGGMYAGVTTNALSLTSVPAPMNGYTYQCIVTGTCNPPATSATALLTVNTPPAITVQPSPTTVCAGTLASFSLTATGSGLTYQWQVSTGGPYANVTNGPVYSGVTTATLNVTSPTGVMNGYMYRVYVTGTCLPVDTSNMAILTVNTPPVITTQPSNLNACNGQPATFTVVASGGANTYQWQENNGGGFVNLVGSPQYVGVTTSTLTITNPTLAMTGYTYQCVIGSTCPPGTTSNIATMTVGVTPTATAGGSTLICPGSNATVAGATATGGTILWTSNGFGTITGGTTLTPTYHSTYADAGIVTMTMTVTNVDGCQATATYNVNFKPTLTATITGTTTICTGNTTTLTANSPGPGNTYQWTGGPATAIYAIPGPLTVNTTYTVTVTNAISTCSMPFTQLVTINQLPTASGPGGTANVCVNDSAQVFGMHGTNGTFSWSHNGTGTVSTVGANTLTPYYIAGAGDAGNTVTMTLTTTSNNTCAPATATSSLFTFTVKGLPAVGITGTNTICPTTNDVLTGTGANGYVWTGGPSVSTYTVSPVVPTTYTVTGINTVTGCSNTATFAVGLFSAPVIGITSNPSNDSVCPGVSITLTGTGPGGTTYSWNPSITDGTPFVPALTQTYTVTGTDGNGCKGTAMQTVTLNPAPTVNVSPSPASATVCTGQTLTLSGGGASTYSWTGGITDGVAFTPSPVGTTTYTVTGTDVHGCTNTATQSVTVYALPTITATVSPAASVCPGTNVTLNGVGGTSYIWTGGVVNNSPFVPLGTQTYTVTGSDAHTCTNTATQTVTVYTSPVITTTVIPASAEVCAGAHVTLAGHGAVSYVWSNGITDNTSFVPSLSLTYTVTGTDVHGCTDTATRTVVVDSLPVLSVIATPPGGVVCSGTHVTLAGSGGGATYTWTGGITNNVSFTPAVGTVTYTVTSSNSHGCVGTTTQTVVVNPLPTITTSAVPANATICVGGTIALIGHGASLYSWTGGVTNNTGFNPTASATYTVTGTDGNGCMNTATEAIIVHQLPVITVASVPANDTICAGAPVTLTASGAGGGTYSWSSGLTNGVAFSPNFTATYRVTGTDVNSCANDANVTVAVISLPVLSVIATPSNATVCAGGMVRLAGSGANTYTWSGGILNDTLFTPVSSMTYTLTGSNTHNCVSTTTQLVTVNPLPSVTVVALPANATVCKGNTVNLSGAGADTYSWSAGVVNNAGFVPTTSATYTVTGTDANGCMGTATKTVTVNPLPVVTYVQNPNTVCVNNPPFTLSQGLPAGGTYSGPGVSGTTFTPVIAGGGIWPIVYMYTDGNGCTDHATASISVGCLGIDEIAAAGNGMNVYPNPFQNSITVVFGAESSERTVAIYDLLGKQVYNAKVEAQSFDVDLTSLPQGVYLIVANAGNERMMKRIVKQ